MRFMLITPGDAEVHVSLLCIYYSTRRGLCVRSITHTSRFPPSPCTTYILPVSSTHILVGNLTSCLLISCLMWRLSTHSSSTLCLLMSVTKIEWLWQTMSWGLNPSWPRCVCGFSPSQSPAQPDCCHSLWWQIQVMWAEPQLYLAPHPVACSLCVSPHLT